MARCQLEFVIWGGLNGLGLVVYKFWRKISPWEKLDNWAVNLWKITLTFTFITFTRVFFRSDTMEVVSGMLHQIFTDMHLSVIPQVIAGY